MKAASFMTTWEEKFVRFMAERWVFQGSDPHGFTPRLLLLAFGEDFISPLLERHEHFGALYSGYLGGRKIGYIRVPPGTVILEGIMRSLAFTRVDSVIGIGTCGALQKDIDCGDIVVAESAWAGDCLSMHYGFDYGDRIDADIELSASLAESMLHHGLPVHKGPIVTTGAAFRETEDLLRSWSSDGYLGVELEASSLFALGDFMKVSTAISLLVTDSPVRMETSNVLNGKQREAFVDSLTDYVVSTSIA